MAKEKVFLSQGVRHETGVEDSVIETNVTHIQNIYGHIVGQVTVEDEEYQARLIPLREANWYVDTGRGILGRK